MTTSKRAIEELERLTSVFFEILDTKPIEFSGLLRKNAENFVAQLYAYQKPCDPKQAALRAIKRKLKLEDKNLKEIINKSAALRIFFNATEKKGIFEDLCDGDINKVHIRLMNKGLSEKDINSVLKNVSPLSDSETLKNFHSQVDRPINRRTKQIDTSLQETMLEAIFSNFLYEIFEEKYIHCLNSNQSIDEYEDDYWTFINQASGGRPKRNKSLAYISLNSAHYAKLDYNLLRELVCEYVRHCFETVNNHGYLAIQIPYSIKNSWELASDVILFSEKFFEHEESISYFKPNKIKSTTEEYISGDLSEALFQKVNEGFFYKDTFCLYSDSIGETGPDLLLLFRKDVRDESKIPCPKCRSFKVQGNSYPRLGVKSWECKNLICADRSMSNRGKRFSYESLLKQQSIDCPDSQIDKGLLSRWKRDVLFNYEQAEVFEYLIKCYSLPGDTIHFYNETPELSFGRTIATNSWSDSYTTKNWETFESIDFFKRWLFSQETQYADSQARVHRLNDGTTILQGDSEITLKGIPEQSISGAVTSPPYYNAREYSQYPNIYCYLYKMNAIAKEVFRVLKPGSVFIFNIFDYFDNEKIVIDSAMGEKRMILSAYIVHAFKKLGFEFVTNIPWDKGEIEGNRAYNAGNLSPYYQSPLNCWEHNLVFKKPGDSNYTWPKILKCKPVFKMVNGENTYGHTAPFPLEIPNLLTSQLGQDCTILDPFAGSGTTGLSAKKNHQTSILCEAMDEYVSLIKAKLN